MKKKLVIFGLVALTIWGTDPAELATPPEMPV